MSSGYNQALIAWLDVNPTTIRSTTTILVTENYAKVHMRWLIDCFLVFNATFSNISAISWRPVLVVEEAEASRVHLFCNLQSRARTHGVLVIGLNELLSNPTT